MNDHPPRHAKPESPTTVRLMGTTPMRDWARGRLTGRLDYARLIADSGLPPVIQEAILDVARRTRLWRLEKSDIARELIAHFRDWLDAGGDPARLVADFGDAAKAARLMRRAKKRNRPLAWRSMIHARNGIAALVALLLLTYAVLAVRYFSGSPRINHDYLADVNAAALATPAEDRAWPLYQRALALMPETLPDELSNVVGVFGWLPEQDPRRPAFLAYLESAQPALDLLAEAAARPRMGHIIGADPEEMATSEVPVGNAEVQQPMLLEILLPSLGRMRSAARLASDDLQLAAQRQDAARAMRDLRILCGLADHHVESPFLIGQLVGMAVFGLTADRTLAVVGEYPDLFSDAQLRELAHRLSAIGGGTLRIRFDGERAMFEDTIQHMYTDDGDGDGRIAGRSSRRVASLLIAATPYGAPQSRLSRILGPISTVLTANRAELVRTYDSLLAEVMTHAQQPAWLRTDPQATAKVEAWSDDWRIMARYWPLVVTMPAFDMMQPSADVTTQRRDATVTLLALELHRRRHGVWPDSLAALTPGLLPTVPLDQFDGRPLKYFVRDGRPVLYSVGVDRKDDHGRRPENDTGAAGRWISAARARQLMQNEPLQRPQIDGDWVLFPVAPARIDPPLEPPPATDAAPGAATVPD